MSPIKINSLICCLGPKNWGGNYYFCSNDIEGARQSPINIMTKDVVYNASLPTLSRVNYEKQDATKKYTLANKGHGVVIQFPEPHDVEVNYNGMYLT